jgi:hypothetical protein
MKRADWVTLADWFAVGWLLGALLPASKPRPRKPEPIAVALLVGPLADCGCSECSDPPSSAAAATD